MGGGEGREVYGYPAGGAITVSFSYGLHTIGVGVVLMRESLSPRNIKVPNGLRYHLIDIYLDELEKLEPVDSEESADIPIDLLIQPYEQLVGKSPTKVVRIRSRGILQDERLGKWGYTKANKGEGGAANGEGEEEWAGFD